MYCIDEGLSVISAEVTDRLDLILAREDHPDEGNDLGWGRRTTDQTFPGGCVGVDGNG